jgi:hypothetical protein
MKTETLDRIIQAELAVLDFIDLLSRAMRSIKTDRTLDKFDSCRRDHFPNTQPCIR